MTIPEPTYVSAAEVIEQTFITALQNLPTESITKIIQAAEAQIDAYCHKQPHHPYDSNLDRVFPRAQDFAVAAVNGYRTDYPQTPAIPLDVSLACLRQTEWLYLQWWPSSATAQAGSNKDVEQESVGGDGSYSATYAAAGDYSAASLCDQAKALLNGYRSRWAPLSTTDIRTSPPPRAC